MNDANIKNEFSNQTAIQFLLKKCSGFKLFVILDAGQVEMARGSKFVQAVTAILRKLSDKSMDKSELKKFICPYFVKYGEVASKEFFDK